jgi:hypothetical protein
VLAGEIIVYKTAQCGCCKLWVKHLRDNGFKVTAHDVKNLSRHKADNGVPRALESCHTATVDGYVIEGHVPASDIKRLLKEAPPVRGLAVPGMPIGSPGMEQGDRKDRYEVLTFDNQGNTEVFARH